MEYQSAFEKHRAIKSDRVGVWIHRIKELAGFSSDSIFVDLGCGVGRFTIPVSQKCHVCLGVDCSFDMLNIAKKKEKTATNILWVCSDARNTPIGDGYADVVLASMLLEHVVDKDAFFCELARIMKFGGRCVLRTMLPHDIEGTTWYSFSCLAKMIERERTLSLEQIESYCSQHQLKIISANSFSDEVDGNETARLPQRLADRSYEVLHRIDEFELNSIVNKSRFWLLHGGGVEVKSSSLVVIARGCV